MKNLFLPILILALIVGLGCGKGMFAEKSIVGKWKEKRTYNLSNQPKWIDVDKAEDFIEFTTGGELGLLF